MEKFFDDITEVSPHPNKKSNSLEAFEGFITNGIYDMLDFNRRDPDMYLTWRNLDLTVDIKSYQYLFFCKTKTTQHLIKNNSGYAKSGECLAILGGSGAGKSTLLNILADRFEKKGNMKYNRDVRLNKEPVTWDKFKNITGFVMQKAKFFSDLTVREILKFNSYMKFGQIRKPDIRRKVQGVIDFLKLTNAQDTMVGGLFRKSISGGEQKRLNIGSEMIRDPKILFLDEPTSGLDSYTSYLIIQRLRELARKNNMIIIYTIHQPSINAYHLFDNLMVLHQGKTIYFGSAAALTDFYQRMGIRPIGYKSPSELLIAAAIKNNPILETPFFTDNPLHIEQDLIEIGKIMLNIKMDKKINRPSFCRQFSLMTKRNFQNYIRNPMTFHIRIGQTIFLAIIFVLMYGGLDELNLEKPITINNRLGAYYFSSAIVYVGYFLLTVLICILISSTRA